MDNITFQAIMQDIKQQLGHDDFRIKVGLTSGNELQGSRPRLVSINVIALETPSGRWRYIALSAIENLIVAS